MLEESKTVNSSIGKLAKTSQEFRKFFLLRFTKELIKQSKIEEFFALEHELKKKEKSKRFLKDFKENEKEQDDFILSLMHRGPRPVKEEKLGFPPQIFKTLSRPTPIPLRRPTGVLRIPEYQLPQRLQYLQPTPTNIQIDLGILNGLAQDPNVRIMECNGPDEKIIVKGNMGTKTTKIVLGKEGINDILQRFSQVSKIPIQEGVIKIVVGKFILSAIISEVVGSKFIIRKMTQQMVPPRPMGFPPGPMRHRY